MSIFVSIASYHDPVLGFTIARASAAANRPQDLHFGVFEQSPAAWPSLASVDLSPSRLSFARIEPIHARGPCWARAIAMSFYDGEDWFFQLDSHMDFDDGWDDTLIAQAQALMPGRRGVVISAYPNAFVLDGTTSVRKPTTSRVLAHVVKPGAVFADDHRVLSFEAHPVDTLDPVPGFHLGAGCLFAPGEYAQAFPYDPHFYFHGEEQGIAARLFSHGWDIFHMAGLPVYHLYNNGESGGPARPMHWDAELDSQRKQNWWSLEQASRKRLDALVAGENLGVFSLGKARSMADYAAFCGIDYAAKKLSDQAYKPLPTPLPTA